MNASFGLRKEGGNEGRKEETKGEKYANALDCKKDVIGIKIVHEDIERISFARRYILWSSKNWGDLRTSKQTN